MNKYIGKKASIVVESPFQLLCAYEAIDFFKVDYDLYIRLSDSESTNKQMKKIVSDLHIFNVYYVYFSSKKDFFTIFKMIVFILKLKFKHYDYYFLGNYLSGFLHLFTKFVQQEKIVLLDDGVATFKIQRELQKRVLPITLFTIFDIKEFNNQKICHNTFSMLKSLYTKRETNYDVFIGAKLVDLGILPKENYFKIIKIAIENSKENKLYYFPHRESSQELLNEISSFKNLEVVYPDVTIEFFLLREGINPKNIYSIISSALFSLSIIFEDANIVAHKVNFKKNVREKDIEKIYEMIAYQENRIKLIDMSLEN